MHLFFTFYTTVESDLCITITVLKNSKSNCIFTLSCECYIFISFYIVINASISAWSNPCGISSKAILVVMNFLTFLHLEKSLSLSSFL